MTELMHDPIHGSFVINETDVANGDIIRSLSDTQPEMAALMRWAANIHGRSGSLFERDRFATPQKIFDQMLVAQDAAETDDVVASIVESTEALAFSRLSIECADADEESIWNQIAADLELDARLREMWRELFVLSTFTVASWWGFKNYTVKGRSKTGVKRKKTFRVQVPLGLSILDPMKIVPVGTFTFNNESLAWAAQTSEAQDIARSLSSNGVVGGEQDALVSRLIMRPYEPSVAERRLLSDLGVEARSLFLLNPDFVWRHTATRPQYKRFADVRMKSIFELLDMKHQLREMDRSTLLGSANFIVLVKRGDKDNPAKQAEVNDMQSQIRVLARVPVIVSDHRLSIEIITPKNDFTLKAERYDTIDARIAARLYQTFMHGNSGSSGRDDSLKLARVIARGLESRRHMLRRSLEKNVINKIYDRNDELTSPPSLEFHPRQIALDFDAAMMGFYRDLRDRREISRSTLLEQIDLDEGDEGLKREREAEHWDAVFDTLTALQDPNLQAELQKEVNKTAPKPAPIPRQAEDPKAAGRSKGGTANGGGSGTVDPGRGQPQDPRRKPSK